MTFKCESCTWRGAEESLARFDDLHCHPDTGAVLADNGWIECPECGGDVIEED